MLINDLLDKVNKVKRKRERERVKTAKNRAVVICAAAVIGAGVITGILLFATKSGMVIREKMKNRAIDTVENVKNIIIKSADAVEVSTAHTADKVSSAIEASHNKAEAIKKEFKNGSDEIIKDAHETAGNIAKAFKE